MKTQASNLVYALAYARKGLSVFPCKGKIPLTEHGFKDATIDEFKIKDWWKSSPEANIGIACGKVSGITVLDIDPRNGGDITHTSVSNLPKTPKVITGGGGFHLYFKYNGSSSGILGKGLDLQSDGKYVIAPPSIHPDTSKTYDWDNELTISKVPFADAQDLKIEHKVLSISPDADIPEGGRNHSLASMAGAMRRKGFSQETIEVALLEENTKKCNPPLPEYEVKNIAKSVARYEPAEGKDRQVGQAVNNVGNLPVLSVKSKDIFPLSAVPNGWLNDYIEFAKPLTEASEIFHFATGLAVLSSAIGRKVYKDFGTNTLYPNFYILLIGDSGVSRKSSAISLGKKFLRAVNPEVLTYDTFSLEAFLESCQLCPQKFLFFDEFRSLIELENKSYGKGLVTLLTRAWSCPDEISTGFKNIPIEKRIIQEPYFTLLSATTLDWLAVNREDVTGGFLGRFMPILSSGSENIIPIPPKLPQVEFSMLASQLNELAQIKGVVTFSDEARELYSVQYKEHKRELKERHDSDLLQPFYSRIDVNIIKLATIFQITMDQQLDISLDAMQRATCCMEHIKLCYVDLVEKQIVFSEAMKIERKIIEIIEENNGIKHREMAPRLNCPAKDYNPAIDSLIDKCKIRKEGSQYYLENY